MLSGKHGIQAASRSWLAAALVGVLGSAVVQQTASPALGQSQVAQSQPSEEALLAETEILDQQLVQLRQAGQYGEAIPIAERILEITGRC